jgi:hypothetical protein
MIALLIVTTDFVICQFESRMNFKKLVTSRRGALAPNILPAPFAAKRFTFTADTTYRYRINDRGEISQPVHLACEPWPAGLSPIWYSECCNAD